MNGAEGLVRPLIASTIKVCLANVGTSAMHFVAALDRVEGIRCILGLFGGDLTGAADAYYHVNPASARPQLGPGLGVSGPHFVELPMQ